MRLGLFATVAVSLLAVHSQAAKLQQTAGTLNTFNECVAAMKAIELMQNDNFDWDRAKALEFTQSEAETASEADLEARSEALAQIMLDAAAKANLSVDSEA